MKPPTKRQLECLRAIDAYIRANGFSPTTRDLCRDLGVNSINCVIGFLYALETRHGLITRSLACSRTLRLTPKGQALLAREALPAFRAEARIEELGL